MKKVEEKSGVPSDEQRLIYAGKQLEKEDTLADYPPLGNRATIYLVLRLPGGAGNKAFDPMKQRPLPRHLPQSDTPCIICYEDQALLMPCKTVKHSICSTCLMNFAWNEVSDNLKTKISCSLCGSEWGLDVVKEYGQATQEEIELLSEGLSMNVIHSDPKIIECPGCGSYCQRIDDTKARVSCRMCRKEGKNADYCWFCFQPWKSSGTECSNPKCQSSGILAQIQNSPMKEINGVKCPSWRLCPNCGLAIEHKNGCKCMTCKKANGGCDTSFCFICLRIKKEGSWQCGGPYDVCQAAPIQDRVPKH